jgi:hypothetical protein
MGTSWGAAIDYLHTSLSNGVTTPMGAVIPALSTLDPLVVVTDNEPATTSPSMVVIGRTSAEIGDLGSATAQYAELGAGRIEEDYTIPGYVDVFRPGPTQKPARDAAIVLFDGIVRLIHTDPTFGGVLQRGQVGMVSRFAPYQTQDEQDVAAGGQLRARIAFDIAVHNKYIP